MTNQQLADELRRAVERAQKGQITETIHLFGIVHAEQLKGRNTREIAALAGISDNYGAELNKMVRLAKHVRPI
jgi:hypothetical protein